MDDVRELYQATILDHNRSPRNFGPLEGANRSARGENPVCGDKLVVYLDLDEDERVTDVRFDGRGCAISTASASLMTEFVKGRKPDEIEETFERFHALVAGNPGEKVSEEKVRAEGLGKLAVFSGVREYPVRVKCATLCWHTLRSALREDNEVARTE
jgi:nitrogen fixation NifU-like protein